MFRLIIFVILSFLILYTVQLFYNYLARIDKNKTQLNIDLERKEDSNYTIVRCAKCGKEIAFNKKYYWRTYIADMYWTVCKGKPYCPHCSKKANNEIIENIEPNNKEFR